jgi:hypothetical protein
MAALAAVAEASPVVLSFADLLASVRSRAGVFEDDEQLLSDLILFNFACGIFRLHVYSPPFATDVSAHPRASALARMQAQQGIYVTNLRHACVRMEDEHAKRLLTLLDGTRDRAALLAEMSAATATEAPEQELDQSLSVLAKLALLEA